MAVKNTTPVHRVPKNGGWVWGVGVELRTRQQIEAFGTRGCRQGRKMCPGQNLPSPSLGSMAGPENSMDTRHICETRIPRKGTWLRPKNEFLWGLLGQQARRHRSKKHLSPVPPDSKMGQVYQRKKNKAKPKANTHTNRNPTKTHTHTHTHTHTRTLAKVT